VSHKKEAAASYDDVEEKGEGASELRCLIKRRRRRRQAMMTERRKERERQ